MFHPLYSITNKEQLMKYMQNHTMSTEVSHAFLWINMHLHSNKEKWKTKVTPWCTAAVGKQKAHSVSEESIGLKTFMGLVIANQHCQAV